MKMMKKYLLVTLLLFMVAAVIPDSFYTSEMEVQAASTYTGWKTSGTKKYYYVRGKRITGQKKIGKYYYYFNSKGVLQKNKIVKVNGKKYFFQSNGIRHTGKNCFKKINGYYYWFNSKSQLSIKKGWQMISGNKVYLSKKGKPYTGYRKIGNYYYYFNTKGVLKKSCFLTVNGKRYYFTSNGKQYVKKNLYKKVNGIYYWIDEDSSFSIKDGISKINGKNYYINKSGKIETGLIEVDGKLFYFNKSMQTGFQTIHGKTYYFNTNGAVKGWQTINGNLYYFDSTFVMKTNTEMDGYRIDENGTAVKITPTPTPLPKITTAVQVKTEPVMKPEKTEEELLNDISVDMKKASEVFQLINEEREKQGLQPFVWNERLLSGSASMAGYNIMQALKNPYVVTDTALHGRGQIGVGGMYILPTEKCVSLWMNSALHKSSILTKSYGTAAVSYLSGACKDKYGNDRYYTSVILTLGPAVERDQQFSDEKVLESMCSTVSAYMDKDTVLQYKRLFADPYTSE